MKRIVFGIAALAAGLTMALPAQAAKNVKVTPLGSVDGKFCRLDRALIFEDPDGMRILYDAGRTGRSASRQNRCSADQPCAW